MSGLPISGRIGCTLCHIGSVDFGRTVRTEGDWRITANPLAWGNPNAEIVVLGFSKGPTQLSALASKAHNEIPYAGGRANIGKIFARLDLISSGSNAHYNREVSDLIADQNGRFHFGSLIRCSAEQNLAGKWSGTKGGMLDKFARSKLGSEVTKNCTGKFLADLPSRTRLVLMFGTGSKLNYVSSCREAISAARSGNWQTINDVAYTDGKITVVHTEHFKSQGSLLPDWLDPRSARGQLGIAAHNAVKQALAQN